MFIVTDEVLGHPQMSTSSTQSAQRRRGRLLDENIRRRLSTIHLTQPFAVAWTSNDINGRNPIDEYNFVRYVDMSMNRHWDDNNEKTSQAVERFYSNKVERDTIQIPIVILTKA